MRSFRLPLAAILLMAALATPRVALAQQASPTGPDSAKASGMTAVLLGEASIQAELGHLSRDTSGAVIDRGAQVAADGYRALAADPAQTAALLRQVIGDVYLARAGARSAVQASQAIDEQQLRLSILRAAQEARIIAQNDRIIQLLEAIAKPK